MHRYLMMTNLDTGIMLY